MLIGLDRPVRPEWVYELLKMVEIGTAPARYYLPFETIAAQLTGKEAKRKVRTIIFRSFIYSFQDDNKFILPNPLIELTQTREAEFMRPVFLAKLIFDYQICQRIVPKFQLYKNRNHEIPLQLISKKMVSEYGDRDVVKRSVRSTIRTLSYFKAVRMADNTAIIQNAPAVICPEQWKIILKLYAGFYLKSHIIDLDSINRDLLFFLSIEDNFHDAVREYHGKDWEFIRDPSRNLLFI
ncbi:MAG: hypothetical protein U9P10_10120 [Thermodesulfobacteriota bacterium]|nr:hypothetical protein [Thermodesulfobacteriota bacterium]